MSLGPVLAKVSQLYRHTFRVVRLRITRQLGKEGLEQHRLLCRQRLSESDVIHSQFS